MSIASSGQPRAARSPAGLAGLFTGVLRHPYPLLAALVILLAGVLHLLTLRPGIDWDGDYALYIMHAVNIVHGTPYAETGYLFNPESPYWPASYPPGLPLLLAPVYAAFGIDIEAMKILLVLCFLGSIAVFARIARRTLPAGAALVAVAALAFNPFVLGFKNSLYSEFAFLLAAYLALHLTDRLEDGLSPAARIAVILAAGLALGFAYEIRMAGAVLFCAVAAIGVLRVRAGGGAALGVLAVGGLTASIIGALFPADIGTYLGFFEDRSLAELVAGAGSYRPAFLSMLGLAGLPAPLSGAIGGAVAGFAVAGLADSMRARITVFDVFFFGYAVLLLLYPIKEEPARYALPLLPLLLLYAVRGICLLGRRAGRAGIWIMTAAAFGLFAIAYEHALRSVPLKPAEPWTSATGPGIQAFFKEVKTATPEDAVIMTSDPTIVALFTGRHAVVWGEGEEKNKDEEAFRRDLAASGAGYLIENRTHKADGGAFPFTKDIVEELEVVCENGPLVLYRVR